MMEIVLNEYSLDGQFETMDLFFDSLIPIIKIHKLIKEADTVALLRHHEMYQRLVTHDKTLHDVMVDNRSRTSDEIRVFKRMIRELTSEDPYWTTLPRHKASDSYVNATYGSIPANGHGLAEACERDKVIVSFKHPAFEDDTIEILKNNKPIIIMNFIDPSQLSELMHERGLVTPHLYCKYRFNSEKLCFDLLEEDHGFGLLTEGEERAFISSFKSFHELSWDEILKSDGLEYKLYSPSRKEEDWFRRSQYTNKNISKFRTSRKYRCFGFREGDAFFVLRFELDHKESDKG